MSYIRKCSLIVYGATSFGAPDGSVPGLDLSQFRIQFSVSAMDVDEPPTARIRVFNLADSTAKQIQNEFQNVKLQAGYEDGPFGSIFQGTIVRVRRGRLSNIESFVDIMASNFDAIYNFGFVSKSVASNMSYADQLGIVAKGVSDFNASLLPSQNTPNLQQQLQYGTLPPGIGAGGVLPRGKVMFGLAREHLTRIADSSAATWSVGPDGRVNILPLTGYLPGEAVVLTSATGLIGVPEATQQGIEMTALLNPNIVIGTRVQLNNADINTTQNKQGLASVFPGYGDFAFFANTSDDGFYRVLVAEHEGDTRGHGQDWLTKITALALDASAADAAGAVQPYGWQGVT